jgi:diguanylate cyclase (GGDEF)-like protein
MGSPGFGAWVGVGVGVGAGIGWAAGRRVRGALRRLAYADPLTGLANRAGLRAAAGRLGGGRPAGLLLADLDDFKPVNDEYGHSIGDAVLVEAGRRLATVAASVGATAARLGGDEFALLVPLDCPVGSVAEHRLAEVAGAVQDLLGRPYQVGGRLLRVGASVGTAASGAAWALSGLLAAADAAMYAVKSARRTPARPPAAVVLRAVR